MRTLLQSTVVAAVAALGLAMGAAPALAGDKHTGKDGCFSWSWKEGFATTTVYWHNTCKTTHWLTIVLKNHGTVQKRIKGGDNGSDWWFNEPAVLAISDDGQVT